MKRRCFSGLAPPPLCSPRGWRCLRFGCRVGHARVRIKWNASGRDSPRWLNARRFRCILPPKPSTRLATPVEPLPAPLGPHAAMRPRTRSRFNTSLPRQLSGAGLCTTFGGASRLFGWVLITTSIGLALVPWQLHQRFASWSVPRATRYLPLIGAASLAAGVGVIVALRTPPIGTLPSSRRRVRTGVAPPIAS